jgi:hypothetical protein
MNLVVLSGSNLFPGFYLCPVFLYLVYFCLFSWLQLPCKGGLAFFLVFTEWRLLLCSQNVCAMFFFLSELSKVRA